MRWIPMSLGATNIAQGIPLTEALQCALPQGINGCGFEQPLESMARALDVNAGFRREGALLAVVFVTDEADCSTRSDADSIFLPDGDRTFWSMPEASAPSSAVCWNAGVQCTGAQCSSVSLDAFGQAVAPALGVFFPVSDYVAALSSRGDVYVAALAGVGTDGMVVYQDAVDPDFQNSYGIGPGCSSSAGEAVPPVRLREFVEQVGGGGELFSICAEDYSVALSTIGTQILSRLP